MTVTAAIPAMSESSVFESAAAHPSTAVSAAKVRAAAAVRIAVTEATGTDVAEAAGAIRMREQPRIPKTGPAEIHARPIPSSQRHIRNAAIPHP